MQQKGTLGKSFWHYGDPYGNRTHVYGVRGRCPRPLDEGAVCCFAWGNIGERLAKGKSIRVRGRRGLFCLVLAKKLGRLEQRLRVGKVFYRDSQVLSWALYDWANSAFATTVMAGFFPVFFKEYSNAGVSAELSTLRLGVSNSVASILVAVAAPFLAALADASGKRKSYLLFFTLLGVAASFLLSFLQQGAWLTAALLYGVAVFAFNGAITFYDSFLPDVSGEHSTDKVSGFGFSLGYLGGGLLFLLNVLMLAKPDLFGLADQTMAVRVSFVSVALWWLLFSLPLFFSLPRQIKGVGGRRVIALWREAVLELKKTLRQVFRLRSVLIFLLAYWLYIDGVNSVMKMAIDYGLSLGFGSAGLVRALLLTQFVGVPAALGFGYLAARYGAKLMIICALLVYAGVCCWGAFLSASWEFYALATVIGCVQGGVQALSRSLYSDMVPREESAQFFSFFNIVGRFATIIGPILVGLTAYYSGSTRLGIFSLILLFVLGAMFLSRVQLPVKEGC